jgi:hypothetical protein
VPGLQQRQHGLPMHLKASIALEDIVVGKSKGIAQFGICGFETANV